MQIVTRFAPSPTGFMHIGNLRTALYSYLIAKSQGGRFILRIEDTDQKRLIEGAVEVILNTLKTTRICYDEGPDIGGEHGPYIQSQRKPIYQEYAQKLIQSGQAYYCFCTEERLEQVRDAFGNYDRHCRDLSQEEVEKNLAAGMPWVIRQKMPLTGTTTYTDAVFGEIATNNKELTDQILIKTDGFPTYNFAHVVDDHLMGVTHVVRGSEYLTSTPKYALLYDALGWNRPVYVHLPLLMGRDAEGNIAKLSKRHGAVSFEDLVQDGYLPEAVINYTALLGWCPKDSNEEFFSIEDLIRTFSIEAVSNSPSVFDYDKLLWFNGEYIRKLDFATFYAMAEPHLQKALPDFADLQSVARLLQGRIQKLSEIPAMIDFLAELPDYNPALFTHKKNKTNPEVAARILTAAQPLLTGLTEWNNDLLYAKLQDLAKELEIKSGAVLWVIRIAVAGKAATPGGATEIMELLGQAESLRRLQIAQIKLS